MGKITDFLLGRDLLDEPNGSDSRRTLRPGTQQEGLSLYPPTRSALPTVTQAQALRVADCYAACRVLADGVASLPPRVYRRTPQGRIPAGDDQRLAQLLRQPSPGSTSADLFSTAMVGLLLDGNTFIGKFRSEGSIVQLACLDPQSVTVEQRGSRIVYTYSRPEGISEHGPDDIVHVKAMSQDGLRGLSPVKQAMRVLQLNAGLIDNLSNWLGNDSRPGGVLSLGGDRQPGRDEMLGLKEDAEELYGWQGKPPGHGRIAVMTGDLSYAAIDPPLREQEFIAQRELSAREVARVMRVPAWAIDAPTGDSLTYSNVSQQNRHLLDHCLQPWLVRLERAFTNDTDLCFGHPQTGSPLVPLEGPQAVQSRGQVCRRPRRSVPRSAPHLRDAHGGGRHADADLAGVDGPRRLQDDPDLRGLLARRAPRP
jgi:HK97 family phage portal protein